MFSKTVLKIRQIRNDKNFTQEFVADKIGISQSHYAKLENGNVKINLGMLQKIAEALEINVLDLMI